MHTYIRTYTYIHTYIHMYIHTDGKKQASSSRAAYSSFVQANTYMHEIHSCIHTHTCIYIYTHTHIHTHTYTCTHIIHTYIHTYIHTSNLHTCIQNIACFHRFWIWDLSAVSTLRCSKMPERQRGRRTMLWWAWGHCTVCAGHVGLRTWCVCVCVFVYIGRTNTGPLTMCWWSCACISTL